MEMTEEEKQAAEAKAKADADAAAAAEAAKEKDVEYWKSEAKKAFEDRDKAKNEFRDLQSRVQQPPVQLAAAQPEEDLNELYWKEPAKVMEKLIGKHIEPFYEDRYEMQKAKYANDPNFQKYSSQIDQMVKTQPELKTKAGIVDQLYRVVRAMEFDPDAERKRIEAEVMQKFNLKQAGSLEGAGTPPGVTPTTAAVDLTDDQKKVAVKFYPDLAPQDAYKAYSANLVKWQQGA